MRWVLIDLVLVFGALGLLAVLLLGLWRKVKALTRAIAEAGDVVGSATEALAVAQGAGPLGSAVSTEPGAGIDPPLAPSLGNPRNGPRA